MSMRSIQSAIARSPDRSVNRLPVRASLVLFSIA